MVRGPLLHACIAASVGLCTTIAVTFALVIFAEEPAARLDSRLETQSYVEMAGRADTLGRTTLFLAVVRRSGDEGERGVGDHVAGESPIGWPLKTRGLSRDRFQPGLAESETSTIVLVGWPFRSSYRISRHVIRTGYDGALVRGGDGPSGGLRIPTGRGKLAVLPIMPIWRGLLGTTVLYGSLFWFLYMAARVARRRWRVFRGCCSVCGYRLLDEQRCSECGHSGGR